MDFPLERKRLTCYPHRGSSTGIFFLLAAFSRSVISSIASVFRSLNRSSLSLI